jgi:cytochrome c-type biogenesis protein
VAEGTFSAGSYGLGFLAGALTSLSPCVLPLLPLILGSAVAAHRFGPIALGAGLAISFAGVGLFIAITGFALGLDGDVFRLVGAILLLFFGAVLLSQAFQNRLALAAWPLGARAQAMIDRINPARLRGQFTLGVLLGVVWSPCVGPTLGAAATLAAQRQNLGQVSTLMLLFALGAAVPMLLIGTLSREVVARWRGRMLHASNAGKQALGVVMITLALGILVHLDRSVEAALVAWSPEWLTDITTRF